MQPKVPVPVGVVFGVMATAGGTKLFDGIFALRYMIERDLVTLSNTLLPLFNLLLGAVVLCVSIAFIYRNMWARKPLLMLAIVLLILDLATAVGTSRSAPTFDDTPSFLVAAIIWIAYCFVAWLLTTQAVRRFAQKQSHASSS